MDACGTVSTRLDSYRRNTGCLDQSDELTQALAACVSPLESVPASSIPASYALPWHSLQSHRYELEKLQYYRDHGIRCWQWEPNVEKVIPDFPGKI
jgi:hypothetical protein